MGFPTLIEVVPLRAPIEAEVTVPGSKSLTNRALILAALSVGETVLEGALWSEDTQVMVECLRVLGFQVEVTPDPAEEANRIIRVAGRGGEIPNAGSSTQPVELFVGNAGTAARFVTALVCLGRGAYRLSGVQRMHERPQAALFNALRELGYRIDSANNKLPATVHGSGPRPGARCVVSIEESSQFASALLLAGSIGGWEIRVEGENAEESPYVQMTSGLCGQFPRGGGQFQIEPDASSASYLWGANWLLNQREQTRGSRVGVAHWMKRSLQIDAQFPELIARFPEIISRQHDLGDSIMTAIVLAPFAQGPRLFTDLARLRMQECERVAALHEELAKAGATVAERGETLQVFPTELHGAEIETYNDHRMAMCFGMVGLAVAGMRLHNPACVKKTFPNFFQKLALAAPNGLGATLLDGSGQRLSMEGLHAE